ncbi:glucose-1-phosphate thymidylyltransferase [Tepidimicrobium xylanilyticum]|uniref:Glucose-1-phosphate thymidylyltransferase n=1 Tax=Tepidimicrobium xylanilyticum TaxID=1123352 RepID=A0A1H2SKV8_9FIRM|nr:glucose-1-phosphate thymidylyltransferase [Tepidimicrobium xylanilyticum]GMG96190.1 glucose-1-phosphate thymidylyltransferase [Tepidimicrobium xylanilyticum]SDW32095.1 glucose-1-phosphate thymidylyltransferase [Tepidimicrobium xylanilyticum]
MKGLILCGGISTRLNPITYSIPKQLIPIGNKPLLAYTIELLLESGITELGILVNEFNKPIFERVLKNYFNDDFHYIIQYEPKGIAHGLLFAEELINGEKFLMILGDNYFDFNLKDFVKDFETGYMNCKILLKEVENPERFGVAYIGDGRIIDLEEKPKMAFSNWAVTGLYAFDNNIFKASKKIKPSKRGEYEIIDAIKWLLQEGYSVGYEKINGKWRDIGNPSDVINQNIDILSSIKDNIKGEIVDSHVSGRIILGNGSAIYNSTIRGPIVIGEKTIIKNSYIGPYTSIGNSVNIEVSNLENSIILDGCNIWGVEDPIDSSIVGEGSMIMGNKGKKKTHRIIVGRSSKIYLSV